jgi:ligand-binding SRPBCC domain-containing protein
MLPANNAALTNNIVRGITNCSAVVIINTFAIFIKKGWFKTLSGDYRAMFPGQIIQYIVTPVMGIPMKWVTEITHVQDRNYFVDEQRFGPYDLWHHKHFLKAIPGGVEMEDIVDYKVPMGFIGQLVHPFLVQPKLNEIFEYRRTKLIELFGEFKG